MKDISLIEEIVLLAVWKLEDNAYGVSIRHHVSETINRILPYGTLYSALAKLEKMGYLTKIVSDPTPERGGRSKNYYQMTPNGIVALKNSLELRKTLWDDETQMALSQV